MKSEVRHPQQHIAKRWMLVDDNEEFLMMISAMVENLTGATIECHNLPISALAAFMAEPEAYASGDHWIMRCRA